MTLELAHEPGCNQRHKRRQRCNGPVAEARRAEREQEPSFDRNRVGLASSLAAPYWRTDSVPPGYRDCCGLVR
jgi:hypothetical protein